jgi:Fe-S-cluster containining protein
MNHKEEPEDLLWLDYLIEPTILRTFVKYCKDLLVDGAHNESTQRMSNEIIIAADSIWLDIESEIPSFDCRKGCSWCCHQSVSVTWPELLNVFDYLRNNLEPVQIERLKNKSKKNADEIVKRFYDASSGAFHGITCIFLEDNICSIHETRPLQCRGGFSEEESYCKSLLHDTKNTQKAVEEGRLTGKFLIVPKIIYNSAQVAMTYAMSDEGMKGSTYELTVAISILAAKLGDDDGETLLEKDLKPALIPQHFKV